MMWVKIIKIYPRTRVHGQKELIKIMFDFTQTRISRSENYLAIVL